MSRENVERWRAALEVFRNEVASPDRANVIAAVLEICDPEIVWDASMAAMPDLAGVYHGHEGVRRFWEIWLEAWEAVEFEYELIDAEDEVVLLVDQRMRGRSTGIEVALPPYAQVGTFREGSMVHWRAYADQAEALKAVSLSE